MSNEFTDRNYLQNIGENKLNVDIISGATITSEAIIEAVIEAKNQAEGYRE